MNRRHFRTRSGALDAAPALNPHELFWLSVGCGTEIPLD